MPKRMSNHERASLSALVSGIKASASAFAADMGWKGRAKTAHTNPFGEALGEISERSGGIIGELARHAITLSPLTKRRAFPKLDNVPEGLTLGWAQLPREGGRGFSLGIFTDRDHFAQVAWADRHGRVFVGTDPDMDVQDMQPRFMFGKEKELDLPTDARLGGRGHRGVGWKDALWELKDDAEDAMGAVASAFTDTQSAKRPDAARVKAIAGSVVGRDDTGRMTWLASWLKSGNRYTLEQMRADLPVDMRERLEYRDAITIAFFAAYMLPQINGMLIGFGSGNIFRRLNREAPIGAIRRCVRDTMAAHAHGMRASGLEDHFADLMREAGALDTTPGLEAVHGAEPLHLYTSTYAGTYFFTWDQSLAFSQALKSLKIEGNLNRFASVSAWLERNAARGLYPTEDTVTRAEAAQIDMQLLENPAIMALTPLDDTDDETRDDGNGREMLKLMRIARRVSQRCSDQFADPRGSSDKPSEWVYRQTLSSLLRRLRLPYRFDVEFRSHLQIGEVALGFTTAGTSMMPESRYDASHRTWRALSDIERAAMSAAYNLRVGLIMAALSFGADSAVRSVSLHIDSIGLEEAIAEQDSAIQEMMREALLAFEHMRSGDMGRAGSKADPKDGDFHGDPSVPITHAPDTSDNSDNDGDSADDGDKASVDAQFNTLMQGLDIDEMAFSQGNGEHSNATRDSSSVHSIGTEGLASEAVTDDSADAADSSNNGDPLEALRRNPTVRNLVTVTFTREAFERRLRADGLEHPEDTYRMFDAVMDVDGEGGLKPISADFDLHDSRFSPVGSQEEPELADRLFQQATARVLGAANSVGLSIQREDLLQYGVNECHAIARHDEMDSVSKAQHAMQLIESICDPELTALAPQITSALIDGSDTPDFNFSLADNLDKERLRARDMLFSGQVDQALETAEAAVRQMDQRFAANPGVPRYFNSYAERVVYNRLFATMDERTVLIPDNLFYAHMELADVLGQLKGAKASIDHLNAMVAYAPAYPLSHLKLAIQLARLEDWDSARAACLNALRVALDRDDAAFAYYRFAYAEWMLDRFDTAVAAYIMSDHIAPGAIGSLESELQELVARADSQCIRVPENVDEAARVLASHDLPVWPHIEVADIVRDAARVCVDEGMFVPARTLSVAAARMNDGEGDNIDMIQAQFLRSLSA